VFITDKNDTFHFADGATTGHFRLLALAMRRDELGNPVLVEGVAPAVSNTFVVRALAAEVHFCRRNQAVAVLGFGQQWCEKVDEQKEGKADNACLLLWFNTPGWCCFVYVWGYARCWSSTGLARHNSGAQQVYT
jgi:hypothetical protein